MAKPVVVIVGRPNVGKSTLFNRIVGSHAAIIEDVPGVTRDRNYMDANWEGKAFVAVDTGGFYPKKDDNIFSQIKEQALYAIDEADVIIHLLDAKDGLNPYDMELAEILRASGKHVLTLVNKVDGPTREPLVSDFYGLGVADLAGVSAASGYGFEELMDRVAALIAHSEADEPQYPKVAVVGRPNVGKSTLINALLGKERMLVSPVPGTTRDSIDTVCTYYKRKYLFIDTAGIRRKDRIGYSIERFAMVRTLRSIERCDVAVIAIDAKAGIVSEDQKIAGLVHEAGKGAVFMLNKWDLLEEPEAAYKRMLQELRGKVWFLDHAPVLTASALDRRRITKVFGLIDGVIKQRRKRIGTPALNRFIQNISLPPHKGKKVKLLYVTQVDVEPPRFLIFTNNPEGVKGNALRFIESKLREEYSFAGTPIKIHVRARA